jgi:hypothetical protein
MFWFFRERSPQVPKSPRKRNTRSNNGRHEVLLFRDHEVRIERRAYKRSIGLTLQVNGRIRVSAPKSTPVWRIKEFLHANTDWIETHLEMYHSLRAAYPAKRYVQGEPFRYLGEQLTLAFRKGTGARVKVHALDQELVVEIPARYWEEFDPEIPHPELARSIIDFYKRAGRDIVGSRVEKFSARMRLKPNGVRFRSQKTRWGSCSAKGCISLNWRLIVAPLVVIDYVVVHELAHLKHYNHSDDFWELVSSQIPEHIHTQTWLRDNQYETDFLAKVSELHSDSV